MKQLLISILFTLKCLSVNAQAFTLDSSFIPFFDIRSQSNVSIRDVIEINSGSLILSGSFTIQGIHNHDKQTSLTFNGNRNLSFQPTTGSNGGSFVKITDAQYAVGQQFYGKIDTNGTSLTLPWALNYNKTVQCSQGTPYFYPDGSSIFPNGFSQTANGPCPIINPPDTFPGMYLVKVTPQGLWDSTFRAFPNFPPLGVVRYDSTRLLVYGLTSRFTHYNGVRVNGLCRIFADGSLDTTFQSPLVDTLAIQIVAVPKLVDSSGKFFITGTFMLNDTTAKKSTLARLNPDGSIDRSFQNLWGANYTPYSDGTFIETIVSSSDKGYLVGGTFDQYQGVSKNSIVKLDSNGRLETQYFTGTGPDSSQGSATSARVIKILKSKFGGYYVAGDFLKWDGQPSQPIVRIHGLNGGIPVGLDETGLRAEPRSEVSIYPNPTTGVFTVESELGINEIEVYNLSFVRLSFLRPYFDHSSYLESSVGQRNGRSLDKRQIHLSLNNFPQGIYFLKIELKNGEVVTKKMVKQ